MGNESGKGQHRSSLAARANPPIGGIGAGLPQNHKVMGASDPDQAAKDAADPAAARLLAEQKAEEEIKLAARRERIYAAFQQGEIFEGEDEEEVAGRLLATADEQLRVWEQKLDQQEQEKIDQEEIDRVGAAVEGFEINPDQPGYQYLFDKTLRIKTEKDLPEIPFGDLIFLGHADQEVQIHPKLKVVFRTVGTQYSLWIERRLHEAARMSEQYGRHWFSMLQLAVSVQTINGKPIGPSLEAFDEENHVTEFWKVHAIRLKKINKMPAEITDLLIANMAWFQGRVRKEIVGDLTEKVGNS